MAKVTLGRRVLSLQPRLRCRNRLLSAFVFLFVFIFLVIGYSARISSAKPRPLDVATLRLSFPLTEKHIRPSSGGAWYIPPQWLNETSSEQPKTIVEAASLVSRQALDDPNKLVAFSSIPLIIHQTWKSANTSNWKPDTVKGVEKWLRYAVSPRGSQPMAYMLWDDDGIRSFMETFEAEFDGDFKKMTKIQQTDAFRVLVCKHIGGIYADIDTTPLRPPPTWINSTDMQPWHDDMMDRTYSSTHNVSLIVGIEGDADPDLDRFWRMGYRYPVQLTQWAFAASPGHPMLDRFVQTLRQQISLAEGRAQGAGVPFDAAMLDPLLLTGPVAFTEAVKAWLEETVGLRWNSLTGLKDGGKSKLVQDVMVLPITGFSPGRQKAMGSKPVTDPSARLAHEFQGSWRSWSLRVEFGKICRTALGLCRDWPTV